MKGTLVTHPAVRLRVPSYLTGNRWVAEHLLQRRRFALSPAAVLLLVAFLHPAEAHTVVAKVASRLRLPEERVRLLAAQLMALGLLRHADLDGDDDAHGGDSTRIPDETRWLEEVCRRWEARGWRAAVDYYVLTYDYPFLDYSVDGRLVDLARMTDYSKQEPDVERSKTYPDRLALIPLPKPCADLVTAGLAETWKRAAPPRKLDRESLAALLSLAFGKIGEIRMPWPNAKPALRRTSPSGGARHPTEAYVIVLQVEGLRPGTYHVAVEEPALELLSEGVDPPSVRQLAFGAVDRAPFPVGAVLLLTCVWERNMYRYREPRTFRAVHMDAGHLTASVEVLAAGLGLSAFAHYGIDDRALECHLGLDGLEEGAMLAVALGNGLEGGNGR